jgi:hypothetical protein
MTALRMTNTWRIGALGAALLAATACARDAANDVVGITATGSVIGSVRFDADGSGNVSVADVPMAGVRLRLLTPIARDTVLRGATAADGSFQFAGVPVGTYVVVVDSASLGDTVTARVPAGVSVTVLPQDTASVDELLSFPSVTALAARTLPLGTRVFVQGVALHARTTFSDTLLHVADTTGALRATRVRATTALAGDGVRLRGRIAQRDGQPVLDDVSVFVVGDAGLLPAAPILTSSAAATAAAGTRDAALVRLLGVAVVDTATVLGNLQVTVNDGSGPVVLMLDRAADAAFRPPFAPGAWTAGRLYDVIGVLVPQSPGVWSVRPRSAFDLVAR